MVRLNSALPSFPTPRAPNLPVLTTATGFPARAWSVDRARPPKLVTRRPILPKPTINVFFFLATSHSPFPPRPTPSTKKHKPIAPCLPSRHFFLSFLLIPLLSCPPLRPLYNLTRADPA